MANQQIYFKQQKLEYGGKENRGRLLDKKYQEMVSSQCVYLSNDILTEIILSQK